MLIDFNLRQRIIGIYHNKLVDKIITKLIRKLNNIDNGICDQVTGKPLTDYVINKQNAINEAIDNICQLIPKEGIVIAEGRLDKINDYIGNNHSWSIALRLYEKYDGKKGKLIFIEDKEELK